VGGEGAGWRLACGPGEPVLDPPYEMAEVVLELLCALQRVEQLRVPTSVISRLALDEVRETVSPSRELPLASQARGQPAGSPRIGVPARRSARR